MSMIFYQLLFLIWNVQYSLQNHNPICEPVASVESYKDTLIIFVVDQAITDIKKPHWYFLKQLACSIPISNNIRTLVVDSSQNNTGLTIGKGNVYESKKLVGELFNGFEKRADGSVCRRLETTLNLLVADDFVRSHPNVHFVLPTLDPYCDLPSFGDKSFVSIDFLSKQGEYRFLTIAGEVLVRIEDKFAPKHLVKNTDKLVDHMLHFNEEPVDQCPACNCSESDACMMKWLIGTGTVIISFVYLAIIIIWVRN